MSTARHREHSLLLDLACDDFTNAIIDTEQLRFVLDEDAKRFELRPKTAGNLRA